MYLAIIEARSASVSWLLMYAYGIFKDKEERLFAMSIGSYPKI